jgi:PAS domain S-box-containing protein
MGVVACLNSSVALSGAGISLDLTRVGETEGSGIRSVMQDKIARIIFDSITDGVFTVDENCVITSFNKSAERITGFSAQAAVGKHCFEIFRTEICHKRCALRDTLANHKPVKNARVTIITHEGKESTISVSTTVLRGANGEMIGGVEFFRDLSEFEHLQQRLDQEKVVESLVATSPSMRRMIGMLPNIAESECNVLLQGPSGTGKELFAQAIHALSPRRYGPYIKLNCGALPATLLESELFGYVKGAFTDAKRDKPGRFALANGGTLLLDEISEMEPSLQVKLLRVLNNGEYQPLGSTKTLRTDARIIAATNANLKDAIRDGAFREDLYFRVNVVALDLPALHERPEDIPLLVEHFVGELCKKKGRPVCDVSPEVLAIFRKYSFPGNVRELENAVEHALVMCQDRQILVEHLPAHLVTESEGSNGFVYDERNERDVIQEALQRHHGNRAKVADELGMHRSTLWRKMKVYRLR